jgi:hypothetical protein
MKRDFYVRGTKGNSTYYYDGCYRPAEHKPGCCIRAFKYEEKDAVVTADFLTKENRFTRIVWEAVHENDVTA